VLRKVESVRDHTSIRDINSAYGEDLIDNPWPVARQIRGSQSLKIQLQSKQQFH